MAVEPNWLVSLNAPNAYLSLAGFEVTIIGRFWVTAEGEGCFSQIEKSSRRHYTREDIDTDRRRIPGLLLQQAKDHVRQASRGSHRVETIAIKTDGPPGG